VDTLDLLATAARPACGTSSILAEILATPDLPRNAGNCPSWCEDVRLDIDACGGEHMAQPFDTAATAGGFRTCDDGALVPMVTTYAHRDAMNNQVCLVIHNPLKDAPDSRYQWIDAHLSPQEARNLAAALLVHADTAERN
jgi:hypothetical protein